VEGLTPTEKFMLLRSNSLAVWQETGEHKIGSCGMRKGVKAKNSQ
jgi:hypothetical protein